MPPRSEMNAPILTQTSVLTPGGVAVPAGQHQYFMPHGSFPPTMMVPHPMQVMPADGGQSPQMHQQIYMAHNGGGSSNTGHPQSNTPSHTPNGPSQAPVVSANGQAFNQNGNPQPVGYPYMLPVMNYAPGHRVIAALPFAPLPSHQGAVPYPSAVTPQGGTPYIPQSQQ